ncbi:unnamed protein product [Linum trigynum]|uniref:Uncharacterized protein n=1 Tax=Linum trigynum TaxID=586398 RepID=A0AAV2E4K2_9ROSI
MVFPVGYTELLPLNISWSPPPSSSDFDSFSNSFALFTLWWSSSVGGGFLDFSAPVSAKICQDCFSDRVRPCGENSSFG